MASPNSTWMDIDDINPHNLQSGIGSSAAQTEAEPNKKASQSLEASKDFLESAIQSMNIQTPCQKHQQSWNPFTESLKSSITYAQGYDTLKNPKRIEANAWLSEIDKLDDEMSIFIHEISEERFPSEEAFDLADQMLCMRQEVSSLSDQSFQLGQRSVNLRQQIENAKHVDVYPPDLTVSFKEEQELRDAIWDLKCLVERYVDFLEITRKKQVELLTRGSMLQSQLDSV